MDVFFMENLIKIDDLEVSPYFWKRPYAKTVSLNSAWLLCDSGKHGLRDLEPLGRGLSSLGVWEAQLSMLNLECNGKIWFKVSEAKHRHVRFTDVFNTWSLQRDDWFKIKTSSDFPVAHLIVVSCCIDIYRTMAAMNGPSLWGLAFGAWASWIQTEMMQSWCDPVKHSVPGQDSFRVFLHFVFGA